MSSIIQQVEYNSSDPPRWFGYDYEGKFLGKHHSMVPQKEDLELMVRDLNIGSEEETV